MTDTGYLTRWFLSDQDAARSARPALSLEDEATWSYGELRAATNRYANAFSSLGIERGDRVGILLRNCLEYWAVYLATMRIGAIAVRLNWRLAPDELAYALDDSGCRLLCLHAEFADTVASIRSQRAVETYAVFPDGAPGAAQLAGLDARELLEHPPHEPEAVLPNGSDAAMIMYTSGTTGRPKGVVWTHANLMWIAAMQAMHWRFDDTRVTMTTGPLYHVSSLEDLALPTLLVGGHTIMMRSGSFTIDRAVALLERFQVTDAVLYPTMILDLIARDDLAHHDLGRLERIVSGGSALGRDAHDALRRRLPNARCFLGYGSTEGGAIITMPTEETVEHDPTAAGKALPFVELRIVTGGGETAEPGTEGEIWVRSPAASRRYWQNPTATADAFVDGWYRTGDAGRLSSGGVLTITGRLREMIKSGSENVYPAEIEAVLERHPQIVEAAVIGVPDPRYQEAVCAVVVRAPDSALDAGSVVDYCREHLAGYKKPRHVVFVDALPRNVIGKIEKPVLEAQYAHLGMPGGVS